MPIKKIVFYIIALCIPFIILLLAEAGLRIVSYGNTYPLFVPATQINGYWQPNPNLVKRYFSANMPSPSVAPDTYFFKKEKPDNTLRIVTMGGSTMAGFPYGRFASPAGMLKQRLKASHPSRNIEIISVAMSSVNTYTLLDITEEIIDIAPDAVLIYAGHNEYLGIMGVGSVYASKGGHITNLLYLQLKEWRLFQLLQVLYTQWFVGIEDEITNVNDQRTVMAQVAKNKSIIFNDDVYKAGTEQFSQNINAILQQFSSANIPVLISNLVANESDQKPFSSVRHTQLDALSKSLIAKQSGIAVTGQDIQIANSIYHADYMFAVAQAYSVGDNHLNAHSFYESAMNYDLLRFRAPTGFNDIIAQAAQRWGATLVDSHAFMHNHIKENIGNNLMLEHLHPNHRGYFLLGEAFYQAFLSEILGPSEFPYSLEQAWRMSPLTPVDEDYANYKIAQLTSDYPFVESKQAVSKPMVTDTISQYVANRIDGASWISIQQALLAYYQHAQEFERAANIAGLLFDAIPNQDQVARVASLLYLQANILPMAQYYALQAVMLNPQDTNYRLSLAEIYYKLGNTSGAIATLNVVLGIDPNNQRAAQIKIQISR